MAAVVVVVWVAVFLGLARPGYGRTGQQGRNERWGVGGGERGLIYWRRVETISMQDGKTNSNLKMLAVNSLAAGGGGLAGGRRAEGEGEGGGGGGAATSRC